MYKFWEQSSDQTVFVHDRESQDIGDKLTCKDRFLDRDLAEDVLVLPTVNDNRFRLCRRSSV